MVDQIEIRATRGSDVRLSVNMGVDLTGRTVEFFDLSKELTGKLTGTIDTMTISLLVKDTETIKPGFYGFRVQATAIGLDDLAPPKFMLEIY